MASFNPQDFGFDEPPPRPTTPPVRRGFLVVLFVLSVLAAIVYGVPYVADQAGYAWESGRSRAASEALLKLDKAGVVGRSSALFRMATAAVAPAVVHVRTARRRKDPAIAGPPHGVAPQFARAFESTGLGSGVIIDRQNGYVVTNNHVVKDADQIVVRLSQGIDLPARVVGTDPRTDLAVLQIHADLRVAAEWGDSDKLDIGDWVLAIGSPFAMDRTVTAGIVSATERNDLQINEYESYIQTDAAINMGNSGGPLVDLSGKVIGINTAIISQSGGYEGIGLAIPSTMARRIVESLIKNGKVVRGYLGVYSHALNQVQADRLNVPQPQGAVIDSVQRGSPADQAGLQAGDVIVKLGDQAIPDTTSLRTMTAGLAIGRKIPISFYRDGQLQSVEITIAELPPRPARR